MVEKPNLNCKRSEFASGSELLKLAVGSEACKFRSGLQFSIKSDLKLRLGFDKYGVDRVVDLKHIRF